MDERRFERWEGLSVRYQEIFFGEGFPIQWIDHSPWDVPIHSVHAHNVLELGYCYGGRGTFIVEGAIHSFRAGDCSVIRRNDCHVAQSTPGEASRWKFIFLEPGRLVGDPGYEADFLRSDTLGGRDFPTIMRPAQHPGICSLIHELARELEQASEGYQASVRGLVAALMPMLHRLPGQASPSGPIGDRSFARIAPALERISRSLDEDLRVEDLAECCELSTGHFRRLFQEAVGESPKQYLIRYRVHQAASMLDDRSRKITAIAFACGFQDLSGFNRHFRSIMGCAPRQWRERIEPKEV